MRLKTANWATGLNAAVGASLELLANFTLQEGTIVSTLRTHQLNGEVGEQGRHLGEGQPYTKSPQTWCQKEERCPFYCLAPRTTEGCNWI